MPSQSGPMPLVPPSLPERRPSITPWVCFGLALTLFISVSLGLMLRMWNRQQDAADVASETENEASPASILPGDQQDLVTPAVSTRPETSQRDSDISGSSSVQTSESVSDADSGSHPMTKLPPEFVDLQRRNFQLELPGRGSIRDGVEVKLAALPVNEGDSLHLALFDKTDTATKLVNSTDSLNGAQAWTVIKQARQALGGDEEKNLGQFLYRDGELQFQWDPVTPAWAKPGSLQFSLLEVKVGSHRALCQLWKPLIVNPIRINLHDTKKEDVPLDGDVVDRPEDVRVQFQLMNVSQTVALNKTAKLVIGEDAEQAIEAEITIEPIEGHCSLHLKLFASLPALGKAGETRAVRQQITPELVQNQLRFNPHKDSIKKKEAEIKRLTARNKSLQKQMELLEKKSVNLPNGGAGDLESAAIEEQSEMIEKKLSKLEAEVEAAHEFTKKNEAWCESVNQQLKALEEQGQLQYAIYVENHQRIHIVETSGFDWDKK